jgi:hypothetical protein
VEHGLKRPDSSGCRQPILGELHSGIRRQVLQFTTIAAPHWLGHKGTTGIFETERATSTQERENLTMPLVATRHTFGRDKPLTLFPIEYGTRAETGC